MIRNKSQSARDYIGDPSFCWLTVTGESDTYHVPGDGFYAWIDTHAVCDDDRRAMLRAVRAALGGDDDE